MAQLGNRKPLSEFDTVFVFLEYINITTDCTDICRKTETGIEINILGLIIERHKQIHKITFLVRLSK